MSVEYRDPATGRLHVDHEMLGRPLTAREAEILVLVLDGLKGVEIERKLGMAHATVERHLQHIRQKLGARTTTHAAVIAVRALCQAMASSAA